MAKNEKTAMGIDPSKPAVILRACAEYDTDRIERIVHAGLESMDLTPFGRTLVKPNCVASGEYFPHAYTRPEFLEGVLRAVRRRGGSNIERLTLGERCGITVPTRFAFKEAGYYPMLDRVKGVEASHFDEVSQVEIPLYHEGRLRDSFFTPKPVAEADFFVNCPKFKAHPWTTVTFSMKNYIGIQDDRHRLIDHDWALNQKVADLQYITQPQFICIDGITAGEGRMLTPTPFDLGMVLMGNNQVAFDVVCCHIIGVDPREVDHIRLAHERGFGPIDLDDIQVVGDVPLEEARERADGFEVGLIRVEQYFEGTNIRAYAGPPPSGGLEDYCWGGCPGAIEEAIEILRVIDHGTDKKMPRTHVVFGAYDGPIDAEPGEKIVFIGDCATYHGSVNGERIDVENIYQDRSKMSVYDAKSEDIYMKMAAVEKKFLKARGDDVIVLRGCPVSVAENVLALVKLGKLKNPYLIPKQAVNFTSCYLSMRTRQAMRRVFKGAYQTPGPAVRGAARPPQNLPPAGVAAPLEVQN